ncbi:MAG: glutathione peroxidase [Proteobacteria bacterium]|nr:glutathione peroxidase [Pseudomonadota bacterium]MBI3497051.1 glutathione peroxidase [Pseudomonadota bacterium]
MAKFIKFAGMLLAAASMSVAPPSAAGSKGGFAFEFTGIDGGKLPLAKFAGHPVLVVNTASQCGFTPQYEGLESLWRSYRDRGLVVLGVPSNDFGEQEPGSAAEIKQFCEVNFAVDFPLTDKYSVSGPGAHPFYKWVEAELGESYTPRWNFYKYLLAPDGSLAGAWPSTVTPTSATITQEIEKLLVK